MSPSRSRLPPPVGVRLPKVGVDGNNNDLQMVPNSNDNLVQGTGDPIRNNIVALPKPNVPRYSEMAPEEQAQYRAQFRTKFGILRDAWPNYRIPDIVDTMPLEQVHAEYDVYVRHIYINRDVDKYRVYLVIMWLLIELCCNKLGLNIGGYTVSQMRSMPKYEQLLIELGETNYKTYESEGGSSAPWPVEIRIFFMALVNAVTFIVIKMLASYTQIGENMATTIIDGLTTYLAGGTPQPGQLLFGGPAPNPAGTTTTTVPGGVDTPPLTAPGPFGGIDIASLLGNLGTMFLQNRTSTTTPAPAPAPMAHPAGGPQTPTASRFRPLYDD